MTTKKTTTNNDTLVINDIQHMLKDHDDMIRSMYKIIVTGNGVPSLPEQVRTLNDWKAGVMDNNKWMQRLLLATVIANIALWLFK